MLLDGLILRSGNLMQDGSTKDGENEDGGDKGG